MKRIRLVKVTRVLGIDPGLDGALAFLSDNGKLEVFDMPTIKVPTGRKSKKTGKMGTKREYDFARIRQLLLDYNPVFTVIEELQIGGKPGEFKQSAQSISTTSKNYGILVGLLFGCNLSYEEVRAAVWQKEFFKGKTGNTKELSYNSACKLFPEYCNLFMGVRGGKKDGRTDSSLISLFARRKHLGK